MRLKTFGLYRFISRCWLLLFTSLFTCVFVAKMYSRIVTPQFLLFKGCTCRINSIRALSSDARSVLDNGHSSESDETVPIVTSRILSFPPRFEKPREAWVENMDTAEERKLGLINLHPEVFGVPPRIDVIHENARWQRMYRFVSYAHTKTRAEVRGGGRKPWPQKGLGRARHGSIRSPIWRGGGVVHGPRSPTPHFYMLPFYTRVLGLTSMLSVKLAQDDLHIVNSLEIPNDDSKFIEDLIDCRNWGPSVLFVDELDIMPRNITAATEAIPHVNLMPAYGLNVYSMLKHNTLVLTMAAVNHIEEKLLHHIHRSDGPHVSKKFRISQVG